MENKSIEQAVRSEGMCKIVFPTVALQVCQTVFPKGNIEAMI